MNNQKKILYFISFLLIFFLGGIAGGFFVESKIKIKKQNIYSDCWNDARKELIGICKPMDIDQNAVENNFYGKVIEIDSKNNEVIVDPASLSDGQDNISSLILQINENTKIEQVVKKDDIEYKKELEEYNKNIKTNKGLIYPLQFKREIVDFNSFLVGQSVTVNSSEDIKNKLKVEAVKVTINY